MSKQYQSTRIKVAKEIRNKHPKLRLLRRITKEKTMTLDLLHSRHVLSDLLLGPFFPPLSCTLCALATGSAKHSETDQNGFFLHQGGVGAPPSGAPAPLGSPVPLGSACSSHHLHLETSMILPLDTLHTSTQKHIKNTTSLRPNHQFK